MNVEPIIFIVTVALTQAVISGVFIFVLQRVLCRLLEPKSLNSNYITFSDYSRLIKDLQEALRKEAESDFKVLAVRMDFFEEKLERLEISINELQKEIKKLIERSLFNDNNDLEN